MKRIIGWIAIIGSALLLTSQASALEGIGIQMAAAKDPKAKASQARTEAAVPVSDGGQWWVGAFSGSDLSILGDLTDGVRDWEDMITEIGGEGYSTINNVGILKGIELGCQFDPFNALYLGLESVSNSTQYVQAVDGSDFMTQNVTPGMFGATLNYRLSLAADPASRTSISIGGGVYHAEVGMNGMDTVMGVPPFQANFTGTGFGGVLAFEQEWIVAGAVGIELSIRGRLASVDKLTTTEVVVDGEVQDGNELGLAIGTIGEYDLLIPMDISTIEGGSGIRYAHADYSGVAMALNFKLYL